MQENARGFDAMRLFVSRNKSERIAAKTDCFRITNKSYQFVIRTIILKKYPNT